MWYFIDHIHVYGRFGNVMLAIMNLIRYSIRDHHHFYFRKIDPVFHIPPNTCFVYDRGWIEKIPEEEGETMPIQMLFYNSPVRLFEKERRDICLKYIRHILVQPSTQPENTLVIHIRSGDIFHEHVHPSYMQPPFEYYRYIIDNNDFKKIIVVTEPDMSNPVLLKLVEFYPNVYVFSRSLNQDIATILGAQYLVIGTGSFAYVLSLCSVNLKKLYCFEIHNVYWKDCDYEIIVLQSNPPYPKRWNGDSSILLDNKWKISRKDMQYFVELPKQNWEN
jgi:hypothetical protein